MVKSDFHRFIDRFFDYSHEGTPASPANDPANANSPCQIMDCSLLYLLLKNRLHRIHDGTGAITQQIDSRSLKVSEISRFQFALKHIYFNGRLKII